MSWLVISDLHRMHCTTKSEEEKLKGGIPQVVLNQGNFEVNRCYYVGTLNKSLSENCLQISALPINLSM